MMLLGSSLHPDDQHLVKAAFVHRYTGDHRPNWVNTPRPNGEPYPLQFQDDNDWLENTFFAVKGDGRLSSREQFCESHPTWPNNPELRVSGISKPVAALLR